MRVYTEPHRGVTSSLGRLTPRRPNRFRVESHRARTARLAPMRAAIRSSIARAVAAPSPRRGGRTPAWSVDPIIPERTAFERVVTELASASHGGPPPDLGPAPVPASYFLTGSFVAAGAA